MSAFHTTVNDDRTRTCVPANMREHRANKREQAEARNAAYRERKLQAEMLSEPCPKHRAKGVNAGCPDCDQA